MPLETYTGTEIRPLLARAEAELGTEAVLVHLGHVRRWDGSQAFELLAGDPAMAGQSHRPFLTVGTSQPLTSMSPPPAAMRRAKGNRPAIVALVGPTGVGKTTTIIKLATNRRAFGCRRAGVFSLDTYRVGAVEQLRTYLDIAKLPLQVVHSDRELVPGLARLASRDVILVDTPGWGPKNAANRETVSRWIERIKPDEVHLVLPVGMSERLARRAFDEYDSLGVTHLLPTKLDEIPGEWHLFDLAAERRVPMRWMTDGQEVPTDLRPAGPRLLAALAGTKSRLEAALEEAAC